LIFRLKPEATGMPAVASGFSRKIIDIAGGQTVLDRNQWALAV
jgi:hypothetical protein